MGKQEIRLKVKQKDNASGPKVKEYIEFFQINWLENLFRIKYTYSSLSFAD